MIKKILGIDPAINKCGYAILEYNKKIDAISIICSGTIKNSRNQEKNEIKKIQNIILEIDLILKNNEIDILAIEDSFVNINMKSSLSMAVSRGAIIGLATINNIEIEQLTPKEMKKLITGNGNADKFAVQKMLQLMLPKFNFETDDESDAVGIAVSYILKNKNF